SIDQVDVDAGDAAAASPFDDTAGLPGRLDAPDRPLDRGIEVLHAEAQAVHPRLRQGVEVPGGGLARVDLDGDLAPGGQAEVPADRRHQTRQVPRRQKGRSPAAPVDLHDLAVSGVELSRGQLHLPFEERQVALPPAAVARDHDVAAAEEAAGGAEGDVDVERQGRAAAGARREQGSVLRGTEALPEGRRGRIRGVARARAVVLAREATVELGRRRCLQDAAPKSAISRAAEAGRWPARAKKRTKSASVRMPTGRVPSTTGRQPYLFSNMTNAASPSHWPGSAVSTSDVITSSTRIRCMTPFWRLSGNPARSMSEWRRRSRCVSRPTRSPSLSTTTRWRKRWSSMSS